MRGHFTRRSRIPDLGAFWALRLLNLAERATSSVNARTESICLACNVGKFATLCIAFLRPCHSECQRRTGTQDKKGN